jgi:hypothetical protein
MPALHSRLPALAVVCGAALLGWSLGGVSTLDRLEAATPQRPLPREHFVVDRDRHWHDHSKDREL